MKTLIGHVEHISLNFQEKFGGVVERRIRMHLVVNLESTNKELMKRMKILTIKNLKMIKIVDVHVAKKPVTKFQIVQKILIIEHK